MSLAEYRFLVISIQDGRIVYGNNDRDLCEAKACEYKMNGGRDFVIAEALTRTRLKKEVDMEKI